MLFVNKIFILFICDLIFLPERKAMKRTAIRYITREDGTVRITGIDNAATAIDIKHEFGTKVWDKYRAEYPFYHGTDNGLGLHHHSTVASIYMSLEKGDVYTNEDFASIIGILQTAGNRLIKIAKANPIEKIILI
jgi:hypothetical protein